MLQIPNAGLRLVPKPPRRWRLIDRSQDRGCGRSHRSSSRSHNQDLRHSGDGSNTGEVRKGCGAKGCLGSLRGSRKISPHSWTLRAWTKAKVWKGEVQGWTGPARQRSGRSYARFRAFEQQKTCMILTVESVRLLVRAENCHWSPTIP
jgi:hypothetical protein